jgi:hypothetical protein
MARRELSSFAVLWERHENLYLEIFERALKKLAEKAAIKGNEDAISELLCPIIAEICFFMSSVRNSEIRIPCWEKPIQPLSDLELKGGKIRKRPDFTCNCCNSYADNHEEYEIPFHVECKKLGAPTSPQWILNENYVKEGISRFDSSVHEYGKRADSGLLIGYIINMTPENIEAEVNNYQTSHIPAFPTLKFQFNSSTFLSKTSQKLLRKTVQPLDFKLSHHWIDIRHNYQPA